MIVSHDSGFLDNVCTDIIHYETRKLVHYKVGARFFLPFSSFLCMLCSQLYLDALCRHCEVSVTCGSLPSTPPLLPAPRPPSAFLTPDSQPPSLSLPPSRPHPCRATCLSSSR
jgi:hypothetical protein